MATDLAAKGWDVIAGVRSEQDAARLKAAHHRVTPVILDVTNADDIAALDMSLPERLDAVINNAGVPWSTGRWKQSPLTICVDS